MITRIVIPDLGAAGDSVRLVEWLAQPGDAVTAGEPLFVVETDKAVQRVESFASGYLRKVMLAEGEDADIGAVVALITSDADEPLLDDSPPTTSKSFAGKQRRQAVTEIAPPAAIVKDAANVAAGSVLNDESEERLERLLAMYRRMALIRRYEDHLYRLFLQGLVPGTLHQCQGQEAVAVGVCEALRIDDVIFSTHRPVGHLLAKGADVRAITAEIWGKATGCAGGKGGQMHIVDTRVGAMPSNAIVGANITIAVGAAIGFALRKLDRVAVSFFGDGATNIGAFHEGLNFAAVRNAPVVFVCENNLYAASTSIGQTTRIANLADRASAYGMPGKIVDGMDAIAVHVAAREAVARARAGGGPTLLECKTYRYPGHSRGDPGNYRQQAELAAWKSRDPINAMGRLLRERHGVADSQLDELQQSAQAEVEDAVRFAVDSPDPAPESAVWPVYASEPQS